MRLFYASDYAYGVNPTVNALTVGVGNTTTGAATTYILYDSTVTAAPPSAGFLLATGDECPCVTGYGHDSGDRNPVRRDQPASRPVVQCGVLQHHQRTR